MDIDTFRTRSDAPCDALSPKVSFTTAAQPISTVFTGASCQYWLRQHLLLSEFCSDSVTTPLPPSIPNICPLGIELIVFAPSAELSIRRQIELLEQEMILQAITSNHRPVHLFTLKDPSGSLTASDITELVFLLRQHFNLNHNGKRIYTLNTPPSSLNGNYLALLKGLGFNRIELNTAHLIAGDSNLQTEYFRVLRSNLSQLSEYNFPQPSWIFNYGETTPAEELEQLDYLLSLQPSRIQLREKETTNNPDYSALFSELFHTLRSQNYHCIGNDCFVIASHPIAKAQQQQHQLHSTLGGYNSCNVKDSIGLGAGLYSQMGNVYCRNHTNPQRWEQMLAHSQLPIANQLTLSSRQQQLYSLVNIINLYRELNLDECGK